MNLQPTIKNRKIKSTEEQWTACYCRLSCDDDLDGDSNSIRNQKILLQKYADENHLRNVRFYVDDGFSGSNFERPDFKRMMSDVEDGKISTVIVKDMSRFGRDHILVGYYTKYYLAEADVRFIAIYDQVDSEENPDDDITPFKNILNEMYAKDCSKKIKAVAFSISLRCLSLTVRISLSVGTSAQILCGIDICTLNVLCFLFRFVPSFSSSMFLRCQTASIIPWCSGLHLARPSFFAKASFLPPV